MDISVLKMNTRVTNAVDYVKRSVEKAMDIEIQPSRDIEILVETIYRATTLDTTDAIKSLTALIDVLSHDQMIFLRFLGADLFDYQENGHYSSDNVRKEIRKLLQEKRKYGLPEISHDFTSMLRA
ncbi:MAG: hypothetical protein ACI93R_000401 [Flavobacteriales bacterium]|jgi:hypothetical protein